MLDCDPLLLGLLLPAAGQTQRLLLRVPAAAAGLNAQLDGVAGPVPQLRLAERPLLALVSAQGEEAPCW